MYTPAQTNIAQPQRNLLPSFERPTPPEFKNSTPDDWMRKIVANYNAADQTFYPQVFFNRQAGPLPREHTLQFMIDLSRKRMDFEQLLTHIPDQDFSAVDISVSIKRIGQAGIIGIRNLLGTKGEGSLSKQELKFLFNRYSYDGYDAYILAKDLLRRNPRGIDQSTLKYILSLVHGDLRAETVIGIIDLEKIAEQIPQTWDHFLDPIRISRETIPENPSRDLQPEIGLSRLISPIMRWRDNLRAHILRKREMEKTRKKGLSPSDSLRQRIRKKLGLRSVPTKRRGEIKERRFYQSVNKAEQTGESDSIVAKSVTGTRHKLQNLPNQDAYYRSSDSQTIAVFDGVTRCKDGAWASRTASSVFGKKSQTSSIRDSLFEAHRKLYQHADEEGVYATTGLAARIQKGKLHLANSGDSNAYLIRKNNITRLTTPQENPNKKNELTSCLGNDEEPEIESTSIDLEVGDVIVLCSDGLWKKVPKSEIQRTISQSGSLSEANEQLIKRAVELGSRDDITILLKKIAKTDMM